MGDDTVLVAFSITSLLLRKDLSLSRRIFQWIIGFPCLYFLDEDPSKVPELTVKAVSDALLLFLKEGDPPGKTLVRFFKVMTCILDKPEISLHLIASKVVIKSVVLLHDLNVPPSQDDIKAIEQASLFFEMIDASHFWSNLNGTIKSSTDSATLSDICKCIRFCLSNFHIYDSQIQSTLFPDLFQSLSMKALECKSFSGEYTSALRELFMHIEFNGEHSRVLKDVLRSLYFLMDFVVSSCSDFCTCDFNILALLKQIQEKLLVKDDLPLISELSTKLSCFSEALIKVTFTKMNDVLCLQILKQILSFKLPKRFLSDSTVCKILDFIWKSFSQDDVSDLLFIFNLLCNMFPKIVESKLSYCLINFHRKEDFIALSKVMKQECYPLLFKPICICFSFNSAQRIDHSLSPVDVFSTVDIGRFLDLLAASFVEFCLQPDKRPSQDLFIYLLQVLHNLMDFEDLPSIKNSIIGNISTGSVTEIQDLFFFEASTNRADFIMSILLEYRLSHMCFLGVSLNLLVKKLALTNFYGP